MPVTLKTTIYTLLARRDYSSHRLTQKLLTKGFQPSEITSVLEELRQSGVVSDQRFLESFIRYRRSRGYGPQRIRQELLAEGLSKEMIEEQLDIAHNEWFAEAQRVWQKRFRGKRAKNLQEKSKQLRFLHYRGFTSEQIEAIFDTNNDIETHAQDKDNLIPERRSGPHEP
jgi:regulatory protein